MIPEIDAYRYSKIASLCIDKDRAGYEYTPTESDILQKLYYDIAAVQDVVGEDTPAGNHGMPDPWRPSSICPAPCPRA